MAVQLNQYNIPNTNLPLTITPIIPALNNLSVSAVQPPKLDPRPKQPDLTFHCMCCPAFFVNPYMLYQHMNSEHPLPPDAEEEKRKITAGTAEAADDDDLDYSWVLEPVCEIVDLSGNEGENDDDEDGEEEDDDEEEDDSDSESDCSGSDNDDSSSNSSQSSSSSSSTATASDSNSNMHDVISNEERFVEGYYEDNTRMTIMSTNTVPPAIYEEIVGGESSRSSISGISGSNTLPMFELKTADPRESTSIILLNTSERPTNAVEGDNMQAFLPPLASSDTAMGASVATQMLVKPGRGRRSAAQIAQMAALTALTNGDQKCFQCAHCEASFPNAGDLSKHVRCHITNKPFQCAICEKTFTHIGSLNTHIRIHSGEKPYKCELCSKAFTQSSSLMVHVRSHTIRKPHQCHLCDKGFLNSSSLILHLKSHDDIEEFNCPECDKSFKQEDLLDKHMQMHTQQLVYQCAICRGAFRTSSELVQHMKCHMGEKPFTCSICDRSFTQSGSLGIHMRIHTGERPFQCKHCDKAFTQASSLSVHMKIHTGEKSYPCHLCGKAYSQQAYLNKHIQGHMNGINIEMGTPAKVTSGVITANPAAAAIARPLPAAPTAAATAPTPAKGSNVKCLMPVGAMTAQETLVCIVCGALHKDVNSLAQHVTQKHAVLLNNAAAATAAAQKQRFPTAAATVGGGGGGDASEAERRLQEQQYMQQLQLMLRTAATNGGAPMPQIAMDVDDMGKGDGQGGTAAAKEVVDGEVVLEQQDGQAREDVGEMSGINSFGTYGDYTNHVEMAGGHGLDYIKQEFDPDLFDDYGAEEEVETEE